MIKPGDDALYIGPAPGYYGQIVRVLDGPVMCIYQAISGRVKTNIMYHILASDGHGSDGRWCCRPYYLIPLSDPDVEQETEQVKELAR